MTAPGAVAAFASGLFRRLVFQRVTAKVRVCGEGIPELRVASLANKTADIGRLLWFLSTTDDGVRSQKAQHDMQTAQLESKLIHGPISDHERTAAASHQLIAKGL